MLILRPLVFFAGLASAVALPKADGSVVVSTSTILSDLSNLEAAVEAQIKALKAFTGGLLAPVQLTAVTATFDATVLATAKAAADVQLYLGSFSSADSKAITDQLSATLAISDPAVCSLIKSKRPLFDSVGLRPVVEVNLITLQADHLLLSGGLTSKMSPDYTATMQQIAAITTNALNDAIQYYSLTAS